MKNSVTTVQLTSKPLKLHKALAILLFTLGAVLLVSDFVGLGMLLMLVGLVWKWVTEALIYWYHG